MNFEFAGPGAGNIDLTPAKFSFAKDTNPLVVQRIPAPKLIARPQNQQAFVQGEVGSNRHGKTLVARKDLYNRMGA
jgi:hypothetical protein